MLIIRKDEVNNLIATVSMNKTLSNPYYLFSFQHIASKERVSFVPQVITSNCRYDKFRFSEFTTQDLTVVPPQVSFPYLGQYYYSIYEQLTSGNTDPSLAFNKLESGRAVVIVGNDRINECLFEPYISNDEDFANVIYLGEDEDNCIPNDCCVSNTISGATLLLSLLSFGLRGNPYVYNSANLSEQMTYNGTLFNHIVKLDENGNVADNFDSSSLPLLGYITNMVKTNSLGEVAYNVVRTPAQGGGIFVADSNGTLLRQFTNFESIPEVSSFLANQCFELLDDGSLIVFGPFSGYGGVALSGVAKFDSSGTLLPQSSAVTLTYSNYSPTPINILPRACGLFKDRNGKIIFASRSQNLTTNIPTIATYSGVSVGPIFRINDDLSLDTTFQYSLSATNLTTAQQTIAPAVTFSDDNKIIFNSELNNYSGYNSPFVVILNDDGSINTDFVSQFTGTSIGFRSGTLVDGDKFFVYGNFDNYSGSGNNAIVKLDFSGNVDTSFISQATTAGTINGLYKTVDGNYLMTGGFNSTLGTGSYGGYIDSVIKINQFGQPMMCDPLPSPTPTPTITPTITPSITPTTSCPITTQYLEVELSDNTKFKLILWNDSGFSSPASALCDYVISGTAYGSLGTVYNGEETITIGQHQHQFDLASVLLPGEIVSSFVVHSYYTSGCVCPVNLILPASPTPTPTPTPTITPTI